MEEREKVKSNFERTIDVIDRRGASAKSTNTVSVRLRYGMPDEIEGMDFKLVGNKLQSLGDPGAAMRPGFLGLGSVGLCLARMCMRRFAANDLAIRGIEICVQARINHRRAYNLSCDEPAGYQEMKCRYVIDGEEQEEKIIKIIDEIESRSPWLYNFAHSLEIDRIVEMRKEEVGLHSEKVCHTDSNKLAI